MSPPSFTPRLMTIDFYLDVLCPWCYIGKRRVAAALTLLPASVPVRWRSFQLAPDERRIPGPSAEELIKQWRGEQDGAARIHRICQLGAAEGLRLNLDRSRPVNTFDAHRLIQFSAARGCADEMVERLLHAYHTDGLNIADPGVLIDLGIAAGLGRHDLEDLFRGVEFAEQVYADRREAELNAVVGVPTLVIDGRRITAIQPPAELHREIASHLAGAIRNVARRD